MTEIHLVRHGPTHAKTMVGWSDLPADLSDTAALARLSDHLPQDGLVISSDLQRCVATADAIQGNRLRLPHDPHLREINFGDWELRSFKEIEAEDPERIRAYWETPGDVRPPNGESWNEVAQRVDAAMDRLIDTHRGGKLIVVVHFGVILTQIQRAERLTTEEVFGHRIDNLSLTSLTRHDTGWSTQTINHIL
ncbi:histidine phosphatase family protein [Shimia sp. R11_0]|uniref:Alpha-ribazole phosphatase n=1 Tax=Shimia marina TaxID=321267 RepID=A0A0P1EUL7_9RHOB|nr:MULTISPECIES: histidine phosphatase family protein [Shimia]MBO9478308.1 histidine phosphatase family protein [Shimia sp. R11_0]CUH54333.1 Alpha-ribazole phosphatase [Shimia marina]SFE00811.1 Broad specificity phosphatase PhoE [Shimia marina]